MNSLRESIDSQRRRIQGNDMKIFIKQPKLPEAVYDQNRDFKETLGRASLSKKWCKNHPASVWKDGYYKCLEGYYKAEVCIEGVNNG